VDSATAAVLLYCTVVSEILVPRVCGGSKFPEFKKTLEITLHMPPWWIIGYGPEWWAQARYAHWDLGNGNPWWVPENPDSTGNGLLGEDSPVGTVLRPGSLAQAIIR
jgi:hypothetical protein